VTDGPVAVELEIRIVFPLGHGTAEADFVLVRVVVGPHGLRVSHS
jgi:hypothetical protein